jgi:hypothetical protein
MIKKIKIVLYLTVLLPLVILVFTSCTFELINPPPPTEVAFQSSHDGRYIIAMGGDDHWALGQEAELNECGQFIERHLANGKIALKTCHGRYVTAPQNGDERQDWMLGQETKLSDCAQFERYDLGSGRVALKTCAGRFLTAGDGAWPGELAWSIVGETYNMNDWEIFTVVEP